MVLRNLDMVVWTSGFHNPLIHTDFNMFVDEWMSANESPDFTDRLFFSVEYWLLNKSTNIGKTVSNIMIHVNTYCIPIAHADLT